MIRNVTMTVILSVAIACEARAALVTVNDFNDILFWTGSGSNRAALVLDFGDPDYGDALSPRAIAWGYRWGETETRTMADMLFAISGNVVGGPTSANGNDPRLSIDVTYYQSIGDYWINSLTYNQTGLPAGWAAGVREITNDTEDYVYYPGQYALVGTGGSWSGAAFAANWQGVLGTTLVDGSWYGVVQTDGPETYTFAQPVSAVPEPSSVVLVACGATAGVMARWRRKRAA